MKKWLLATVVVLFLATAFVSLGFESSLVLLQWPSAIMLSALGLVLLALWARGWPPKTPTMAHSDISRRDTPARRAPSALPIDREFLPAALELVETPPSPTTTALIWIISLGFATALTWSYFGQLDIHAIAQGKVQPSGRSKIIQPLEPGRIVGVLVENGTSVRAGDVLLELDATETSADQASHERELEAMEAEEERRRTAIAIAQSGLLVPGTIPFTRASNDMRKRHESVLAAEIVQLASSRDNLKAQLEERAAQQKRLTMSISARSQLIAFLKERVAMRDAIDTQWQGYRGKVIDALQEYERERTNLAGEQGQLIEIDAAKRALELKIQGMVAEFVMQQTQKLAEAERTRDRLEQELIKAQSKNQRTRLRAPIDGVVQQLAVTTVGQVVSGGQSLMTIVPLDAPVEVEALILNRDIGFVEVGQTVTVKVDAFPFSRYGTVEGTVTNISRDGVDEKTAANLGDAASVTRSNAPPGATATAQSLVFPARVAIKRQAILVDGKEIKLLPGMAVTVEISTGQRRAIDFVLAPLREFHAGSLHER